MSPAARHALISWITTFCIFVGLLFALLGAPGSSEGAGEAIGRILALTGFAALFTWMVARNKTPPWGAARFVLVYLALLLGLAVVTTIGRARAADPMPIALVFEDGWAVTVHPGVSSRPQDRDLGVRQRAQWTGADGTAAMEFSCMWLTSTPDVPFELEKIAAGVVAGMEANGLTFDHSGPLVRTYGAHEWHEVEGRALLSGEPVGAQRFAVRAGKRCFLSATFAGTPEAYQQQQPVFERVLSTLREIPTD